MCTGCGVSGKERYFPRRACCAARFARERVKARFFQPLQLRGDLADFGIESGHLLVVGLGLLSDGLGLGE